MQQATRFRASVLTIAASAVACAGIAAFHWGPSLSGRSILMAGILMAFLVAGDLFGAVQLPMKSLTVVITISSAICFGTAVTLGPIGALAVGLCKLPIEIYRRKPLLQLTFNVSTYVVTTFGTGIVYLMVADPSQSLVASRKNLIAAVVAVVVFNVINFGLGSFVFAQFANTSQLNMLGSIIRGSAFTMLTLPTLGMLVPILAREHPLAILLMAVPLVGPYLSLRSYAQIHRETRATIERLANLIDQRDPYTARHSRRVTEHVEKLIDELGGISLEDREVILIAAPVHDIGKIGTSDLVLQKPGRLTDEERELINRHAADGSDILKDLSLYRRAAEVVRHHHERWDGRGYPDGISGEAIPIGARIIAVADTYDAMTTDRPYRAGLSSDCALDEIRRCSGSQFDPAVAEAFLRIMERQSPPVELPVLRALAGN